MKTAFLVITLAAVALARPEVNPRKWHPAQPVPEGTNVMSPNANFKTAKAFGKFMPQKSLPLPTTPKEFRSRQSDDVCGQEQKSGKVINGNEAELHQFPWLAHLQCQKALGLYVCTSSIISPQTILTAAHCVIDCNTVTITVGANNWRNPEPGAQQIVGDYKYHEEYNALYLHNDVAVVTFDDPLAIDNELTMLSCMPTEYDPSNLYEGEVVTVTGWGKTSDADPPSDILMFAEDIPIMPNEECAKTYSSLTVEDQDICIDTSVSGICGGDSGGPLNWYDANMMQYTQIGVTSYGHVDGCEFGAPNGYTRTDYFLDWIVANSPDFTIKA